MSQLIVGALDVDHEPRGGHAREDGVGARGQFALDRLASAHLVKAELRMAVDVMAQRA